MARLLNMKSVFEPSRLAGIAMGMYNLDDSIRDFTAHPELRPETWLAVFICQTKRTQFLKV